MFAASPFRADKYYVNFLRLHQARRGVIAKERGVKPGGLHLQCGEPRALQKRPRFVAVDAKVVPAALERDVHRRGRRAVFCGGERSGVAVCENAVSVLYKG